MLGRKEFERSGGKGIRTPGLLIANETLYQLSYTPIEKLDGLVSVERRLAQEAFGTRSVVEQDEFKP